jgi:hypothetical protein
MNAMALPKAYEEVIDFIASGRPETVVAFRPSEEARARVADLIAREKMGTLTADEVSELEHYLQLEHIMRLAKARARQYLSQEGP